MKIKNFWEGCLVVVIASMWSVGNCQTTSFMMRTDKQNYLVGEPIWADVWLRNNGTDDLIRLSEAQLHAGLKAKNSAGVLLQSHGALTLYLTDEMRVEPGDSIHATVNLADQFGQFYRTTTISVLPPGSYTAHCEVEFYYRQSTGITVQTQKSNEIQFQVIEPQGADEKALDLLVSAYEEKRDKNPERAINYLEELIGSLPNSAYLEFALRSLIRVCTFYPELQDSSLEYSLRLIEKLPNSRSAGDAVSNIQRIFTRRHDPERARAYFEEILRTYPGTKAAKYAQWRISLIDHLTLDEWINFNLSLKQLKERGLQPPSF